ncbi:sulfatase-like hydrolase/transferase [Halomicroarcula sp. S1AR25-4]|uniref:sulfatase-like hydrolase/transferase n=1 Tax=Haloarcula sp. S1AR25-4 TaxID=2950538 RepID=UPI002875896E|nr:sulfatase-like hydrolase/transferase [Halomicroarcula sp. S1AR25-4]MDS0279789.1 sulfatase-like hydrolase/transferase [Halomicroarcula sp. S1AR25-4]
MSERVSQPNVLAVLTDQQRWDTLGLYNSPMDLTPTLDDLGQRGTVLEQAITPQPACVPFQATFQTGMFATETGVWRSGLTLDEKIRTLPERFADAGYDVGFVGGWYLSGTFEDPVPESQRGGYTDFWRAADVPEFTSHPTEGYLYDEAGNEITFDTYRTDAFTEFGIEALDTLSEPFFLVVSYLEPHHQNDMWTFVAPEDYAERYGSNPSVPSDLKPYPGDWYDELPDYYGMVKRLDESVDDLLTALDNRGIRENTVFAYTSDHGCHFRTRPGEYKRTAHESAVRVPAILSGPGFENSTNIENPRSIIDLPPTLLDAAGLQIDKELHGNSILPVVRGDEPDENGDVFIQISESQIGRAIRTNRWKYAVAAPKTAGWRGGNGDPASDTYVERYLYDLWEDPDEHVNLAGRPNYRDVRTSLRDRLLEYLREFENADPVIKHQDRGYSES